MEKAKVPESAKAKADTKLTPDSQFLLASEPTELQRRAFELLDIDPAKDVAM